MGSWEDVMGAATSYPQHDTGFVIMKTAHHYPRSANRRRLKIGALLALVASPYAAVSWLDVRDLLNPDRVADQLRAACPFGPILFIALMAAAQCPSCSGPLP